MPGDQSDFDDGGREFAYLDALRRQLTEPPSDLTERRHLRTIVAAREAARRRMRSHTIGRIAALALGAVLIAFNGSALADALPSVGRLATGIGRAAYGVFDGPTAEADRPDYVEPVVMLPKPAVDPVAPTAEPPGEPRSDDRGEIAAAVDAPQPPSEAVPTTEPPPDRVWSGEVCGADVTLRLTDSGVEVDGLEDLSVESSDSKYRIGFGGGSVIVTTDAEGVDVEARCDLYRHAERSTGEDDLQAGDDERGKGDAERKGERRRHRNDDDRNDDDRRDPDHRWGEDGDRHGDDWEWRDDRDDGQGGDG